jgi:hypothetical protein
MTDAPIQPQAPSLTEGEIQAVPGSLAGIMSHQDPRRQYDLDEVMGGGEET